MKPHKNALSLVFTNSAGKVLTVRRSPMKKSFPNFWSLPATALLENESYQTAASRLGKENLGLTSLKIGNAPLGSSESERSAHFLHMTDYEVLKYEDDLTLNREEYTDMKWVTPVELKNLLLTEHDGKMGDCCKVFLKAKGLL